MAYQKRTTDTITAPASTIIEGNPRCFVPGTHRATISRISLKSTNDATGQVNSFLIVLRDQFGSQHQERIFIRSYDGTDISYQLTGLMASCIMDIEELKKAWEALMDDDWSVLSQLPGRELIVVTEQKGDYTNLVEFKSVSQSNRSNSDATGFISSAKTRDSDARS